VTHSDDFDMRAVRRDDELLDALAARMPVPPAYRDDAMADMLAALAADVDYVLVGVGA
jgi:hypothetical protein